MLLGGIPAHNIPMCQGRRNKGHRAIAALLQALHRHPSLCWTAPTERAQLTLKSTRFLVRTSSQTHCDSHSAGLIHIKYLCFIFNHLYKLSGKCRALSFIPTESTYICQMSVTFAGSPKLTLPKMLTLSKCCHYLTRPKKHLSLITQKEAFQ